MVFTVTSNFTCVRFIHIPDHYSEFPFIHLQCISFHIFLQEGYHVLSLVFFLNMCCMRSYLAQAPAKQMRKTASLKPSVVHLDLRTVGGTLGAGLLLPKKRCAFYKSEHCYMTTH